jgi:hypothetical protein
MSDDAWVRLLGRLEFIHEQMSISREELAASLAEAAEAEGLVLRPRRWWRLIA